MNRRNFLKLAGLSASVSMLSEASAVPIREELVEDRNRNRSTVAAMRGMVCSSQPLASQAGLDVLQSGGNAIDAAIAANACLSVVEPINCGPGGDLFAIVWIEKEQKLFGLNASGRAPYDWSLRDAKRMDLEYIPPFSPLAWTVPGCVSGWEALRSRFGSKPFADLFAPAIYYAREGFPISPMIAKEWTVFEPSEHPTLAATFTDGGNMPKFGDVFRNPDIADTFEQLAREGAGAFYEGEIAEKIVGFGKEQGGRFTMKDFADHQADWVEPASTSYRGYDVWEIPPNGQGISVLQMLNLLEHFDIASMEPNSAEHLHCFVEAKKLAFEDRAVYYADMDFADVPLEWLISKDYAAERVKLIDPKKAADSVEPGGPPNKGDTIYLTTADSEGNMVSLIQSTYYGWGSHLVPPGLGFPIQNRGAAFALNSKHRNKLEPHKRPFHTIIPAFVTKDGRPKFSFGVMEGEFQPQGQTQVLMNLLDFGYSPQQAGERPRARHYGSSDPDGSKIERGGSIAFEAGIDDQVKLELAEMGHQLRGGAGKWGGYQGIWRDEDPRRYFGGSEPRKDGSAVGY